LAELGFLIVQRLNGGVTNQPGVNHAPQSIALETYRRRLPMIRDKIAASKAKGMWMGGPLPLGYDVDNRLLVINEVEARRGRRIFNRRFGVWASSHGPLPAASIEELVTQQIVAALSTPLIVQAVWDRMQQIQPDQRDRTAGRLAPLDGQRTVAPAPAGARHHPSHPGRAAAPLHEPAVVPTQPATDGLDDAARAGDGV